MDAAPVRATDVIVTGARVSFEDVELDSPFAMSGRTVAAFTVAEVRLRVRARCGAEAEGVGASVLSVPWAWPGPEPERRDAVLRELTRTLANGVVGGPAADPVAQWRRQARGLGAVLGEVAARHGSPPIPRLAGLLALGAVDTALHDAWARAAGRPAMTMYTAEHLAADLGWLGLPGRYPGEFLRAGNGRLRVQHVVGLEDPLDGDGDGARALARWVASEGLTAVKVKVAGDPRSDAERLAAVHAAAAPHAATLEIAVDANEGYEDPRSALAMLDRLEDLAPDAARSLAYLEQPCPRGAVPDPGALRALSARVPTLLDEGFDDLSVLPALAEQGWSGIVIKAAKGQTPALLAHAYARAHGLAVAVQDLTAVGTAFAHSARLACALVPTFDHLEYNSRQYAPRAAAALARTHPRLATVDGGHITHPLTGAPGLYEL